MLNELGFSEDFETAIPDGLKRDTPRYIFFAGNVLSDAQRNSAEHLYLGGDNYGPGYPALSLTQFILHRCRITPILVRPLAISRDEVVLNNVELERYPNLKIHGESNPRIQHLKVYPNDAINSLIYHEGNIMGKVELTALEGIELFDDKGRVIEANKNRISQIQNHFFPNWSRLADRYDKEHKLPETLRGIEEMIQRGIDNAKDAVLRQTGEEMLKSCEIFRGYANNYLDVEDARVNQGLFASGFSHQYTPVAKALQKQLERTGLNRNAQMQPLQDLTQSVAVIAQGQAALTQLALNQAAATQPAKKKAEVKETAELAA